MNQYDDEIEAARTGWGAPVPISLNSLTADALLLNTECRLQGWSLRSVAAGGAVSANFWNGGSTGGQLVGVVDLPDPSSQTVELGGDGVRCSSGLFVEINSGTLQGVVYVRLPQ